MHNPLFLHTPCGIVSYMLCYDFTNLKFCKDSPIKVFLCMIFIYLFFIYLLLLFFLIIALWIPQRYSTYEKLSCWYYTWNRLISLLCGHVFNDSMKFKNYIMIQWSLRIISSISKFEIKSFIHNMPHKQSLHGAFGKIFSLSILDNKFINSVKNQNNFVLVFVC